MVQPSARQTSDAATFTALLMLSVCALGLLFLVSSLSPFVLGILIIFLIFGPLFTLQYLIWGRWLARLQAQDRQQQATEQASGQATQRPPATRTYVPQDE